MRAILATGMTIPHAGGASTHFELLERSLRNANMLGGRVVGQDGEPTKPARVLGALRALGKTDARRSRLLEETASRLGSAIERCCETGSADLIHCHDPLSAYAALSLPSTRGLDLPVIQTVHGPWSREILTSGVARSSSFHRKAKEIEERVFDRCARLIAVDEGQASILTADFNVPRRKIVVIHNAVDCEEIRAIASNLPAQTPPKPYFIVPRRLVPKNGVTIAIGALGALGQKNVNLAIAGDGPLLDELRTCADRAGLGARVHFLGALSRERLMPLFTKSAGVIVPSVPCEGVVEATSLAVIESFACGVPVIASAIGGLKELISHARTGLLFAAGDVSALADRMAQVLDMTQFERNQMVSTAREAALSAWDVKPWFRSICAIYPAALAASR